MYRFRQYRNGVTRKSLDAFKHLSKIGTLVEIRGYRVRSHFKTYSTSMEYVLVKGTNGSCRFGGLLWGYFGEGPRGLESLLKYLGFGEDVTRLALTLKRFNTPGIDWRIKMPFQLEIRQSEEHILRKSA